MNFYLLGDTHIAIEDAEMTCISELSITVTTDAEEIAAIEADETKEESTLKVFFAAYKEQHNALAGRYGDQQKIAKAAEATTEG